MYLSIATTHRPATDLGFLLHKHPERVHETELTFGKAYVFYPEAADSRCEAVMALDIDPVGLVRGKGRGEGLLDHYVNDRPYAASSFLSVALGRTLRTAMTGVSRERPDLAASDLDLTCVVTPLPVRGEATLPAELFEPLGWTVEASPLSLPGVSSRAYVRLTLGGKGRLSALLNQLYVLIPVLDADKHYWIGDDEVAKLLAKGEGWLAGHPKKEFIARRYFGRKRSLTEEALARLAPEEPAAMDEPVQAETEIPPDAPTRRDAGEAALEAPIRLHDLRLATVVEALRQAGATSVVDLGCGEGRLLARLVVERGFERLIGVDAGVRLLEQAARRLRLNRPGGPPESRVSLLHGALTYRDRRWFGVDAAALVEVIEHLDAERLPALSDVVFGEARPRTVVVTTPNQEYNALFPTLAAGAFRHADHRFEWTRAEFRGWADRICAAHGYTAEFSSIGEPDPTLGAPTQMAVFTRGDA